MHPKWGQNQDSTSKNVDNSVLLTNKSGSAKFSAFYFNEYSMRNTKTFILTSDVVIFDGYAKTA